VGIAEISMQIIDLQEVKNPANLSLIFSNLRRVKFVSGTQSKKADSATGPSPAKQVSHDQPHLHSSGIQQQPVGLVFLRNWSFTWLSKQPNSPGPSNNGLPHCLPAWPQWHASWPTLALPYPGMAPSLPW
jgi:hypothetical protein